MLAEIGLASLAIAFALAIYAAPASVLGARRRSPGLQLSGRNAALLTFPALLLATVMLVIALMTEQYQLSYVYQVTDPQTPAVYRFTALWGSQRGSLLFWSLLMSVFHLRSDLAQLARRAALDALRYRLHDGDIGILSRLIALPGKSI